MAGNDCSSGYKALNGHCVNAIPSTTNPHTTKAYNSNIFNMKYSAILASLSAGFAAADFQIFWTREQVDGLEGASFFNSAPSCDDAGNSVTVVNLGGRNDASSGGVSPVTLSLGRP